MPARIVTTCLAAMFFVGINSCNRPPRLSAEPQGPEEQSLKGISTLCVVVEDLSEAAKGLGLTSEAIQTDVELKLRLAGMNVVRSSGVDTPYLYVRVTVLSRLAADIDVSLRQTARLERNGALDFGVSTWDVGYLAQNVTDQAIRNIIKDKVDAFLNAWLSVNPKK